MSDTLPCGDPAPARSGREALWSAVRTALRAQRAGPSLEPIPRDRPPVASFAQRRLWFVERLSVGSAMHNQTVVFRLIGNLTLPALEASLTEIVRRHEALRTSLRWSGDDLIQEVHPSTPFAVPVVDLRMADAAHRAERVEHATEQEARTPFDIDLPPLLRAKLFRLAGDEHRLVVTVHHLAFDGWSFTVFMHELCALYAAFVAGSPSPLPDLGVQYRDYAIWQRERLQGDTLERLLAFWTRKMSGTLPVLRMPSDRRRERRQHRGGACETFVLARETTDGLKRLAESEGATLFVVLLAGFKVLLHRYTGEEDVIVGSPVANRQHADLDRLIGLFANTLAMRTHVCGEASFRELLAQVRSTVLDAYEHQDLPFEMLIEALGATSRTDMSPLFQTMFAFQNLPRPALTLPGLSVEASNIGNGAAKFDLTLFMWEAPAGIGGLLEYDTDLFDGVTASRWLRHLRVLLGEIVRGPDRKIAHLPLLDDDERQRLLAAGRGNLTPYARNESIPQVFAARFREAPDAVALAFDGGTMRYDELDRQSSRLARHLQRHGVSRGALVGVCLDRSPSFVVTLLAILKAGGAYVPVDPLWPPERIGQLLKPVAVIVTQRALEDRLSAPGKHLVSLDRDAESIAGEAGDVLDSCMGPEDLAYVMFTSGSTGAPKGVCVPHRAVVRLVKGANYAELRRTDMFLQLAPASFDAATFEIWGALLNGATLALAPGAAPSIATIVQAIRRNGVTILFLTTGLFEAFVDAGVTDLATLRQLLVGGDVLSAPHAERFCQRFPDCRLVNCYGPTENTTFTTFHPVEALPGAPGEAIPIGRPVSNSHVYVLDRAGELAPIGVAGEAYVGGDGLMLGYLDDPTSTCERLVPDPFGDDRGARLYRTGDIVRWRSDGTLEFIGRDDDQLKIRGFRVEPGEVESMLGRCPGVRRAAIVAEGGSAQTKRLIAFIVPVPSSRASDEVVGEVRNFLRARLPGYLVPSEFVLVDTMPLGANGKMDRRCLLARGEGARSRSDTFLPARNAHERAMVEAFEHVLGRSPIGVDDDFFDCGGTSLSALRLVAMLEGTLAIELPLASLYEHPTPARLAKLLTQPDARPAQRSTDTGGGESMLVEIKRGGPVAPLFLVPGGHGGMAEMTLYAKALSHVRREQPVYGLLARGVDGRRPPHGSVEEMAQACVAEVRRVQPHGPYALAGECVGGLVALEMAQQIIAQRQEVALLLLLDTWCPTLAGVLHYRYIERTVTLLAARSAVARRGFAEVGQVLRDHVRDRPPFGPVQSLRYAVNVARTLARVGRPWLSAVNAVGKPAAGMERSAAAEANYVERTMQYRPRSYPGRIALIVSASNHRLGLVDPWKALAVGGLSVRTVPGNHDSYLRDTPEVTAAILEECMHEVPGADVQLASMHSRSARA